MADSKFDKYVRTVPKIFNPGTNPVMSALLKAWAGGDCDILEQLDNTKAQLFVKTANGKNLDRIASSLGVRRPIELGLLDEQFRELVPNLSLKDSDTASKIYAIEVV